MKHKKVIIQVLKDLKKERDKLDEAIQVLEAIIEEPEQTEMVTAPKIAKSGRLKSRPTHAQIAGEILAQNGKPMKTREILGAMIDRGHRVAGTLSLYPTLGRDESIFKVARGTWALKAWLDDERYKEMHEEYRQYLASFPLNLAKMSGAEMQRMMEKEEKEGGSEDEPGAAQEGGGGIV